MGVVAILVMSLGRFERIFVPSTPSGSTWNSVANGSVAFEKMFAIVILRVLGQRSNNDLDLFYSQIFKCSF